MSGAWPASEYLVNDRLRFVYCPIPKAASSSLKQWFLTTLGYKPGAANWPTRPHLFLTEWNLGRRAVVPPDYLRFAFVRDPRRRLVSAYLQKFVVRWDAVDSPSRPVVRDVCGGAGRAVDYAKGITFREFVRHVSDCAPGTLDVHWRPQHLFVGPSEPDFVGRVESLEADLSVLSNRVGVRQGAAFRSLQLPYCDARIDGASDMWAGQLGRLPAFPAWRCFFDDELLEIAADVYAEDDRRFGYSAERVVESKREPMPQC